MDKQQVQLLINEVQGHGDAIAKLISKTKQLECMIAFAKMSGLRSILPSLKKALASGLTARFAIGLDFYQTEPELLRQLFRLGGKHALKLYLSDSSSTFHPKVYAMSHGNSYTVVIGSANLTRGGLHDNYEASAQVDARNSTLFQSVKEHIDELISSKELVLATPKRIAEYERRHLINQAQQLLAKRRTEKAFSRAETKTGTDTQTLSEILQEMRDDTSSSGFEENSILRTNNRQNAARKMGEIAGLQNFDAVSFLKHYEDLIGNFHSGGLHRGKNIISQKAEDFCKAMVEAANVGQLNPEDAYQLLLGHFQHIPRAGTNVITEVLHAIDCKRFAVMNQNAVSGLRLAGVYDFPLKPNKTTVNGALYARFCETADAVRQELGLADFTELDALFNYAYWKYEDDSEDEDDQ